MVFVNYAYWWLLWLLDSPFFSYGFFGVRCRWVVLCGLACFQTTKVMTATCPLVYYLWWMWNMMLISFIWYLGIIKFMFSVKRRLLGRDRQKFTSPKHAMHWIDLNLIALSVVVLLNGSAELSVYYRARCMFTMPHSEPIFMMFLVWTVFPVFCRLTRNGSWRQLKSRGICSKRSLLNYGINTKKGMGRRTYLMYTTTQTCWALRRRSTWQTYFMIALGLVQPKWSGNYRLDL